MKKIIILSVIILTIVTKVVAQDSLKISGLIAFSTQGNGMLNGGRFSSNPVADMRVTASYNKLSISVSRKSDLIDATSSANFTGLSSSYVKSWNKYSVIATVEVDNFDQAKEFNLIAPYVIIHRKGIIDIEVMGVYARLFQSKDNLWISRLSAGKSLNKGYKFKIYGWLVSRNDIKYTLAGEISKDITNKVSISMIYHLNDLTNKERKQFGVIRIKYDI